MRQALLEESKKSQLKQIEEKRRLKQAEQDEEDMWQEIQRRTYEDKLSRERMEQSLRNEQNDCVVKYLDWQVTNKSDGKGAKQQEIEEERRLNALKMEEMKRFDAMKKAELVEKQRGFARDCKVSNWLLPFLEGFRRIFTFWFCRNKLKPTKVLRTSNELGI